MTKIIITPTPMGRIPNLDREYKNYPKIECPFVRKMVKGHYLVTPEINPKYKWVFEDKGVKAVDKIDGTNIGIVIKDKQIHRIFNRMNEKFPFSIEKQTKLDGAILEGIAQAIRRGWLKDYEKDCVIYGELIGETIGSGRPPHDVINRHQVKGHLFVPLDYLKRSCYWKSWIQDKYPKTYDVVSGWFKEGLFSLFNQKMRLPEIKAEGLVFCHPDGVRIAKLRRDMFDWFY